MLLCFWNFPKLTLRPFPHFFSPLENFAYKHSVGKMQDLEQLRTSIRLLLRFEEVLEAKSRFLIFREREYLCITGYETYCNFFHSGFDIEVDAQYLVDSHKKTTGDKKMPVFDADYLRSLSAVERARSSMCHTRHIFIDSVRDTCAPHSILIACYFTPYTPYLTNLSLSHNTTQHNDLPFNLIFR